MPFRTFAKFSVIYALVAALLAACGATTAPSGGDGSDIGLGADGKVDGGKGDGTDAGDSGPVVLCGGVTCDDKNPCTDDYCDKTDQKCKSFNNANACDDGDPCTTPDTCSAGACSGKKSNACSDVVETSDAKVDAAKDAGGTGPDLAVGGLVITEIMYNPYGEGKILDANGEWFEIYNPGEAEIDLGGVIVHDAGKDKFTIAAGTKIAGKGYAVIAASADKALNGGVEPAYVYGKNMTMNNTFDAITLEFNGIAIDTVAYDLTKGWLNLNGVSLSLSPTSTDSVANDVADNWCGASGVLADKDKASPGVANSACTSDSDKDGVADDVDNCPTVANPTQLDSNNNGVGDSCEASAPGCGNSTLDVGEGCDDGNKASGDGCSAFCQTEAQIPVGALVFTEFLANPAAVADDVGEWFEVYNTTPADLTVNGMVLQVGTTNAIQHVVESASPVIVPANGYFVFAVDGDLTLNGGVKADYVYTKLLLSATAATLSMRSSGQEVDRVSYDAKFSVVTGKSTALDPAKIATDTNDDGANWCKGVAVYGKGDYGSPGAANPSCSGADLDEDKDTVPDAKDNCKSVKNLDQTDKDGDTVGDACDNCKDVTNTDQADGNKNGVGNVCEPPGCGNAVLEGTEQCDDGNLKAGDGCSAACTVEAGIGPGSLLFTELMPNPDAVGDSFGEWIELYNPSTATVEMSGLIIKVGNQTHAISATKSLPVLGKGYVVLGRSTDLALNGGAKVDYSYGTALTMSNSNPAQIQIIQGVKVIDMVTIGNKPWPAVTAGASMQLSTSKYDATANDIGTNWCLSKVVFGKGDLGTPAGANVDCGGGDKDSDGDTIVDSKDNCPLKLNQDQTDTDADGVGDACDNCAANPNADQIDANGNGIGDVCDNALDLCGNATLDVGEACDDGNKVPNDGCSAACQKENVISGPVPGDLVITEIMNNPTAIADLSGEWFEFQNVSKKIFDLNGMVVLGKGTEKFTVNKSIVMAPGDIFVFGNNASNATNGGVTQAFSYAGGYALGNSADDTVELQWNNVSIDKVVYFNGGSGWVNPSGGASLQLNSAKINAVDNDAGVNWCLSLKAWAAGDKGSPGVANALCP